MIYATIAAWLAALGASPARAQVSERTWQFAIGMSCPGHRAGIAYYRGQVHRYEIRLGVHRTPAVQGERIVGSCDDAIPIVSRWRNLAARRAKQFREYSRRMAARPAHYRGWLCIHGGEGSWTAQTGNGFYGGLQMTWGWAGLVVNAALLSPLAQMRAAEQGYRNAHYSHAWLAGQWPNTYPPCKGYF